MPLHPPQKVGFVEVAVIEIPGLTRVTVAGGDQHVPDLTLILSYKPAQRPEIVMVPPAVATTVYPSCGVVPIQYSTESTTLGVNPLSVIVPLQAPHVVGLVEVVVKEVPPEAVTK